MALLKFGVLGAGVIGVTTALELQSEFPGSSVTIYADRFNQMTTSAVAAGIFRPATSLTICSEKITRKIMHDSYEYYDNIRSQHPFEKHGISQITGYILSSNNPSIVKNDLIDKIVPIYRSATEEELKICPGIWKYGSYFATILTECDSFLPWCLHKFQAQKGTIITRKVCALQDMANENLDVIINCLGFGAKEVCSDRKLVPIRGQVLKVSAKWLKNFYYADYDTYIIPGGETVTLGGCRHYDSYDQEINPYDTKSIWERCTNLIPNLRNCVIGDIKVGLRPHRDPVRLEGEIISAGGKQLKIVHNYGHGGYGVTTAPGSAKYAVLLVKEILQTRSKI